MKIKLVTIIFCISVSLMFAQEVDAVTGASLEIPDETTSALPVLSFRFFGDFAVDASAAGDFSGDPTFTFTQNHQALLIQTAGSPELSLLADIFHPEDLFQMAVAFNSVRLTFGRIFIPFGDFNYHHIYGGRQDDESIFLPKLWSDYGFSLGFSFSETVKLEVYTVNGFDPSALVLANPRFYSVGKVDNDWAKAIGFRLAFAPLSNAAVSFSAYQDVYGDTFDSSISFVGGDASVRFGPLGLKAGGVFGMVGGESFQEFYRWADYGEATYNLAGGWALRLRGGSMDPDTRVSNAEDQNNVNLSVILRERFIEYTFTYFRNFSGGQFADDPAVSDKHQLLLKILVVL